MIPDPFLGDSWDIITDDNGAVIGEVYRLLPAPPPRRRQRKWGTTSTSHLTNTPVLKPME